jgi:DNA-binding response OmpR family regulator
MKFSKGIKLEVTMYNILIVEDEIEISKIVSKYLEKSGYNTFVANDGFKGLEIFNVNEIHLIVLDIMMPGINGYEVLSEVRKISDVPVIMLTAKNLEKDKLKGFDLGVDDYMIKPFSARELVSRIKVFIKRIYGEEKSVLICRELKLDIEKQILTKNDMDIEITSAEFNILKVLFMNKGNVLSREQIIDRAYGYDYDGYMRSIDSVIKRIRQKIEEDTKSPKYLKTKYGAGYIFGDD